MAKEEIVGELDWKEFDSFLSQVFILQDMILVDKENYKIYFDKFYTYMKQGFEKPEVRLHPVKFKFSSSPNEPIKTMEIRHFIVNLIFWEAFLKMDRVQDLNESHILDGYQMSSDYMTQYIDNVVLDPYRKYYTNKKMNRIIERIISKNNKISQDFNEIMAMGISTESFIELDQNIPEARECFRGRLPEGLQPKEIEEYQNKVKNKLIEIMTNNKNCLQPMLRAGTGIKDKQLVEFAGISGLKPDVNGNVVALPINTNFLVGGLNTVESYYVDAQAGRKSVILNKTSMGTSGFFAAKCMMSASSIHLSKSFKKSLKKYRGNTPLQVCNTTRTIEYYVKNKQALKKINRRYYYMSPTMDKMKCVNSKTDKFLIGETIYLRSPITCTCKDGICGSCYGDLAYTNGEENFNIGAYASAMLNNTLQQNILSTKHLLTTNSEELTFSPAFYRFFLLDANRIKIDPDSQENFDDWVIRLYTEDISEFDFKGESDFNSSTNIFYLYNKQTKEKLPIYELKNQDMYLYSDILKSFKKPNKDNDELLELPLSDLDDETYFAIIVVENNELTRPLKNIMKLLDRKDHLGCQTIDEVVNKISDLLIECGHKIDLVHAECIIASIVKDSENILYRPHFEDPLRAQSYQILRVSDALLNSPSLTRSLSFQDLSKQVTNPNTNRKCATSEFDDLYRETLD